MEEEKARDESSEQMEFEWEPEASEEWHRIIDSRSVATKVKDITGSRYITTRVKDTKGPRNIGEVEPEITEQWHHIDDVSNHPRNIRDFRDTAMRMKSNPICTGIG